jgi:hypothetical protein
MNEQVSKPERVFDRDAEWDGLIRFASSGSSDVHLGIVSGRRRQGKTYLLDAEADTFGGFFFTATDATETESLASSGPARGEGVRHEYDEAGLLQRGRLRRRPAR